MADRVRISRISYERLVLLQLPRPSEETIRAAEASLGFALARAANHFSASAPDNARLAPGDWIFLNGPQTEELSQRLAGQLHCAADLAPGKIAWRIEGARAADVVNTGCSLDLRMAAFPPGSITRTLFAQCAAILYRPSPELAFEVVLDRSLETYFQTWLDDAAKL